MFDNRTGGGGGSEGKQNEVKRIGRLLSRYVEWLWPRAVICEAGVDWPK